MNDFLESPQPPDPRKKVKFGEAISERMEDFHTDCDKLRSKYPDMGILICARLKNSPESLLLHNGQLSLLRAAMERIADCLYRGRFIGGKEDPS